MRRVLGWMLLCGVLSGDARARVMPMETQNRLHFGGVWTPGSTGFNLGFDSRMTHVISVDVGSFMSPGQATDPGLEEGNTEAWVLRHGLYVAPGFRIPHRNKGSLVWDLFVRGGFGPVWVADAESDFLVEVNPALNGGADLLFRHGDWGVRFTGRAYYFKPYSKFKQVEVSTVRPQFGASILHQF